MRIVGRFRLALLLLVCVVMVPAVAECALHLWQQRSANPEIYVPDGILGWIFRSGLRQQPGGSPFYINREGLYSDEVPSAHAPDEIRVLCLGDSITCGLSLRGETYPHFLARDLSERDAAHRYRVINAGVPGFTSIQGLLVLDRVAARYRPDVLVVTFLNNEAGVSTYQPVPHGDLDLAMKSLLYDSEFYRLRLAARLKATGVLPLPYTPIESPDHLASFRLNLRAFAYAGRQLGARVLFVEEALSAYLDPTVKRVRTMPSMAPETLLQMRGALREETVGLGLPLARVEAEPDFRTARSRFYLPDDLIHPGPEGNRLMARAVARGLFASGILRPGR